LAAARRKSPAAATSVFRRLAFRARQGYLPTLFNSESPGGMMSPIMMPIDPGVTFH
jgi:hypothetical protein